MLLSVLVSLALAKAPPAAPAPPAPAPAAATTTAAVTTAPVEEDPYLWLEDVTSERSLDWVRARNAATQHELAESDRFQALQTRLLSILDSDATIPYVDEMGKYYYNFWRDAQHPRGTWRRTTPSEYAKAEPKWETVLDLDALGAAEHESWVWSGANCLAPAYTRCLVSLSRGGADAVVVREYDIAARSFVAGGLSLPEAKQDVSWIDADTIWVASDFGPGTTTSSGYPRQARRLRRGAPVSSAELVFEGQESDVSVGAWHDQTKGFERDWIDRSPTFFTNERYLVVDGKPQKLDKPDDAGVTVFREWMYLELRTDWTPAKTTYKAGSLIAIRLDDFLGGARTFDVLFEPGPRTSLAGIALTRHHVVVETLDNVRSRVEVLTPGAKGWSRAPLAGLPENGSVSVSGVDPERSDDVFVTVTDYVTPTTLYGARLGKPGLTPLKSLPGFFDTAGLDVTQHEAISDDGTHVPYFEIAKKDAPKDGSTRTLLYGYGGFEVSLTPSYNALAGAGWIEQGGVYVVANIRGGGEFGPAWHQAALKSERHKAYEDFAAVAKDLVARKVTSVSHLGILGGSNGGLLMGNMLTSYPDLFDAVVCMVPLLDMKRYNKLLAGASWMDEYGNPDIPEEWAYLQNYSPYQKVRADVKYPRTLFMSSTRDDRVHPGHARKMAARMLEQGHDLLYYENIEGGHRGAADNKQTAYKWALAYSFLWNELE